MEQKKRYTLKEKQPHLDGVYKIWMRDYRGKEVESTARWVSTRGCFEDNGHCQNDSVLYWEDKE